MRLFYPLLATSSLRKQTAAQFMLPNCKYRLELHLLPTTVAITPQKLGYMEVARGVTTVISEIKGHLRDFPQIMPSYSYYFFAVWKHLKFWLFAALYVCEFY